MAGVNELHDGRSYTIKVNGVVADYLFDAHESETFNALDAVEWVDCDGEIHVIQLEDRIEIKVWGLGE